MLYQANSCRDWDRIEQSIKNLLKSLGHETRHTPEKGDDLWTLRKKLKRKIEQATCFLCNS